MAVINVRTDEMVKEQATQVFNALGLDMSSAVNIFLKKSIMEQGIPFELKLDIPNEVTVKAIKEGVASIGLKEAIKDEIQSGLVVSVLYPNDPNWNFEKVHDYCYERGFTIYPGKISTTNTFRLCALGAIDEADIKDFFVVFKEALASTGVQMPVHYNV